MPTTRPHVLVMSVVLLAMGATAPATVDDDAHFGSSTELGRGVADPMADAVAADPAPAGPTDGQGVDPTDGVELPGAEPPMPATERAHRQAGDTVAAASPRPPTPPAADDPAADDPAAEDPAADGGGQAQDPGAGDPGAERGADRPDAEALVYEAADGERVDAERVRAFLEDRGAPLADHAEAFIEAGVEHDVDPRVVVGIAVAESSGGEAIPAGSHNAWGWGGSGPHGLAAWSSWETAIDDYTERLGELYDTDRLDESFARTYCPPNWRWWLDTVSWVVAEI